MFQSSHLTDQVPLKGELISRVISQKISIMKHRGTKGWKYWKKMKGTKKYKTNELLNHTKAGEFGPTEI